MNFNTTKTCFVCLQSYSKLVLLVQLGFYREIGAERLGELPLRQ